MKIATIVTTFRKRGEADEILRRLIEERFVACAHLERVSSSFNWKGVERSIDEWKVSLKTTTEKLESAVERLEELHSYETPMIIWHEEDTTETYGTWVVEQTSAQEETDDSSYDQESEEDTREFDD